MDVEQIKTLIELMEQNALTELMIREGEFRLVLKRGAVGVITQAIPAALMQPAAAAMPAPVAAPPPGAAAAAPPSAAPAAKLHEIKAPMVGTYYGSADPESPPFVKVGSHVDKDTVVCIIEAMKVFNEIKAECSGVVERVLAENGGPVEFGQPLFQVRPPA